MALAPHPVGKVFRSGRTLLDAGGFPHPQFLNRAKTEGKMQTLVFNPHRKLTDLAEISSETLEDHGRNQAHAPGCPEGSIYFLLDDLGSAYFSADPLAAIVNGYALLEKDGFAWIRLPDTFWVYGSDGRRIALREYLDQRLPDFFRALYAHDLPPGLREELSSTHGFLQLRRKPYVEKLYIPLEIRMVGKTVRWDMKQPLSTVVEMHEIDL